MKGVIVDRKGRQAVILTVEGRFVKIANKAGYNIGSEIELDSPVIRYNSVLAKISSIAAVFLFVLGLSYGVYSYTTPYSYVDLDINPSVELTANVYDIIIKIKTYNSDAEKLLEKQSLNYISLDKGIEKLLNSAVNQGYLKVETDNAILLTVTGDDMNKADKLSKNLEAVAAEVLDNNKVKSDIVSQKINEKKHEDSKELGISPGKLKLIEKVIESEPELKLEELKDKPVKEIVGHLKKDKKELKDKGMKSGNSLKDNGQVGQEDTNQNKQSGKKPDKNEEQKDNSETYIEQNDSKDGKQDMKQNETQQEKEKNIEKNKKTDDKDANGDSKNKTKHKTDKNKNKSGLGNEKTIIASSDYSDSNSTRNKKDKENKDSEGKDKETMD